MHATHTLIDSPIGELTLTARDGILGGVYYPGHWHLPAAAAFGEHTDTGFEQAETQLIEFLAGGRRAFELDTAPVGNDFQRAVWKLIDEIPYGETATYGALARTLGDLSLARAVGSAVGRNPLSLIVPCHRVVGAGGRLTGYAGGLERKRFLLEREAPVGDLAPTPMARF